MPRLQGKTGLETPDKVLEDFTGYVGANRMKSPQTYPNEVLSALNAGVPDNSDQLNPQDIEDLGWVIDRYAPRLIQKSQPAEAAQFQYNPQQQYQQYQQPPQQYYQQQYQQYQQPPPQQQYYGRTPPVPQQGIVLPQPVPEAEAEGELFRLILSNIYNPMPHLIPPFIDGFKSYYYYYQQHPEALLQILTHNFASAGTIAFQHWMGNRQKVNMDPFTQPGSSPVLGMSSGNPSYRSPHALK